MQEFPLDTQLRRIETVLLAAIPDLIRKENLTNRAYGILLCYIDYTSDSCTPFVCVLPESHRTKCIANRNVEDLWTICSVPGYECSLPDESPIHAQCRDVYRTLSVDREGQDDLKTLLPFRKMIYRVCLSLNQLDWSKVLPVTGDFDSKEDLSRTSGFLDSAVGRTIL